MDGAVRARTFVTQRLSSAQLTSTQLDSTLHREQLQNYFQPLSDYSMFVPVTVT
jgi:hypothetical protein